MAQQLRPDSINEKLAFCKKHGGFWKFTSWYVIGEGPLLISNIEIKSYLLY